MFEHADFFYGMITMAYLVAAAFFWRFWKRTRDRLFTAFSLSFLLLALSAGLASLLSLPFEERSWIYLLRLAAFILLIVAILQKNYGRSA
jgi:hypothetical protein